MNPSLITVILTVYNKEKWLPSTLKGLDDQTYPYWHVIAIDDASTDGSLAILEKWGKAKVIKRSTNAGPVIGRNMGIDELTGDGYVIFLDADDTLYPEFFEKMVGAMERTNLDMCFSLCDRHSDEGITIWGIPDLKYYDKEVMFKQNYISPSFTLLKNEVVRTVGGFCNEVRGVEDWDYWCRVENSGFKIGCLPEKLGKYQIHLCGEASRGLEKHQLVYNRQKKHPKLLRNQTGITGVKEHVEVGVPFLLGFCMMIKKSVIEDIGGLDERFQVGAMEDVDICHRARLAGYKTKKVDGVKIQHIPESTVHHLPQGRDFWERIYNENRSKLADKHNLKRTISVDINTRNRPHSLAQVLLAVINQSYKVTEIIINDDSDPQGRTELHKDSNLSLILAMAQNKGINWHIIYGDAKGQVAGHRRAIKIAKGDFIWRLDDDNVPEPTCLAYLMSRMKYDVGAVGGTVLEPNRINKSEIASNDIRDIYLGLNRQWFIGDKGGEVDHLYSTFVFRKTEDFYPDNLSRVGHREETIMTYRMKRAGWKLIYEPRALTWHLRLPTGGIRDGHHQMFADDERKFIEFLKENGVEPRLPKIIVLDNGLGDHYAFRSVLPEIQKKHPDIILACCYPQVFEGLNVRLTSIGEAKIAGWGGNIYQFMAQNNWKGSLTDAYKAYYS